MYLGVLLERWRWRGLSVLLKFILMSQGRWVLSATYHYLVASHKNCILKSVFPCNCIASSPSLVSVESVLLYYQIMESELKNLGQGEYKGEETGQVGKWVNFWSS